MSIRKHAVSYIQRLQDSKMSTIISYYSCTTFIVFRFLRCTVFFLAMLQIATFSLWYNIMRRKNEIAFGKLSSSLFVMWLRFWADHKRELLRLAAVCRLRSRCMRTRCRLIICRRAIFLGVGGHRLLDSFTAYEWSPNTINSKCNNMNYRLKTCQLRPAFWHNYLLHSCLRTAISFSFFTTHGTLSIPTCLHNEGLFSTMGDTSGYMCLIKYRRNRMK